MSKLTEACCTPAPPAVESSVGKEDTIAGLPVYITGSASSSAAVILVTDIFGYKAPLLRKLADKVADKGYLVIVPNFLGEDFFEPEGGKEIASWLANHKPSDSVGVAKQCVEEIKAKGISSIGVAGFCWGAKVAVLLGKEEIIKAVVQLHPSLIETTDYEEVNVPISVLAAPTDGAEKAIPILASRTELKSYVKIFPDVKHGWTVRYDETDPPAEEAAGVAHNLMLDWFAEYL